MLHAERPEVRPEKPLVLPWIPDILGDGLVLRLHKIWPAIPERHYVPAWQFQIVSPADEFMGSITLRIGDSEDLRCWAGQVGYQVEGAFRGRRIAARSVRLLLPLARQYGLIPLWITCNPDNLASRRSCEIAGGVFVEIVDVPPGTEQHRRGDFRKCRYRFD
jgi:tagatose 1,6-diphosphate aldolase